MLINILQYLTPDSLQVDEIIREVRNPVLQCTALHYDMLHYTLSFVMLFNQFKNNLDPIQTLKGIAKIQTFNMN